MTTDDQRQPAKSQTDQRPLTHYAWLSIAAALVTIAMKTTAWWMTASTGFLSDALEGTVNLAAAMFALFIVRVSEAPPDEDHQYGHDKASYFGSGAEGGLIVVAAIAIVATSGWRLFQPTELHSLSIGLALIGGAALVNLGVGQLLIRVGRKRHAIALEADGQHLMADVWTSVGVIAGVAVAGLTGLHILDPIIGIIVGLMIGYEGSKLVRRSINGLMDMPLAEENIALIREVLDEAKEEMGIDWHALRTRRSGARRFISVHLLVPPDWTIKRGHDLSEVIEEQIRAKVERAVILTHVEPLGDPLSHADLELDRWE